MVMMKTMAAVFRAQQWNQNKYHLREHIRIFQKLTTMSAKLDSLLCYIGCVPITTIEINAIFEPVSKLLMENK